MRVVSGILAVALLPVRTTGVLIEQAVSGTAGRAGLLIEGGQASELSF